MLSPSELLAYFPLPGKGYSAEPLKQGLINDTYLVKKGQATQYILQRINTDVFPDVKGLMGNLELALPYLRASDYHAPELIHTLKGNSYADAGQAGCWRLMTFLSGSITFNTTTRTHVSEEAGRIIARFHKLLETAPITQFTEVIKGFHDLELRLSQFEEAMATTSDDRKTRARPAISLLGELTQDANSPQIGHLPQRVCHNDTKLNNILFAESEQRALCLIDLDTLMKGYFLYDFGDAVRTIVNTAPEDERVLEKIQFSRPLFRAFVQGLGSEPNVLGRDELDNLAYGAVYMPLLHGVRALTDHLNGDIYYQVAYEGQNLDRALSLLTFARKAREETEFMEQTIKDILG